MAVKFQYNKTSLQELNKQLKIRERALPTLKNKESALRMEVKRAKEKAEEYQQKYKERIKAYAHLDRLWIEFKPELLSLEKVNVSSKKIAGVQTPVFEGISLNIKDYNIFAEPKWFPDGFSILKEIILLAYQSKIFTQKMKILDFARKKTTQKVNLYEKVQIPDYQDAIRKIKRFLEDEENLAKSAQKIVKKRTEEMEGIA